MGFTKCNIILVKWPCFSSNVKWVLFTERKYKQYVCLECLNLFEVSTDHLVMIKCSAGKL